MNSKKLRGGYGRLFPMERLVLLLEAFGRGDDAEIEALIRSCPIHKYTMQDQKFWEFHDSSQIITYLFAAHWFHTKGQADKAKLKKNTFYLVGSFFEKGFDLALTEHGSVPLETSTIWQEYEKKVKPFYDFTQQAIEEERLWFSRLKGLYGGFLRFCQAAQLEPHQLLAWVDSLYEEVEEFIKKECQDIQEDKGMADRIFNSFISHWPGLKDKETVL
ncbi:MAG TPA: hypothetical protein DD706_24560 [Nitrospiraceae bacterium]|nr:hypothetical protein [Nitrospiraceae bacterium]